MKAKLTAKQIQAFQLCSGEIGGMTTCEAALEMDISVQAVNRLLARAEERCPELFPILTKQESRVLNMMDKEGLTNTEIATRLDVCCSRVSQIAESLQVKRGRIDQPVVMERYEPHMDSRIARRF